MLLRFSRLLVASGLFAAVAVSSVGGRLATASATTLPVLRVGSATVIEGDTGQAVVDVPVDMSTTSTKTVTANYSITGGGSATAGVDFVAGTGKVKLAPGKVNMQISVRINGDFTKESNEHVAVTLSSAVNATIAVASGGVTIQDDDSDTATGIQVNIGDVSVVETDGGTGHIAELPITLSRPAPSKLKIYYTIDCSTAIPGRDFTQTQSGSISFGVGAQSKVIKFTVLPDQTPEMVKSILDTIKVTVGSATVHEADGQGQIIDDDGPPPNPAALNVGDVARMSVASDGTEGQSAAAGLCGGNGAFGSFDPVTSADGRYTAFVSGASNLVNNDHNGGLDVFVHDRVTGSTERESVKTDGSEVSSPNGNWSGASYPSISADGRYVTFYEQWPLINGVTWQSLGGQIYLHDRVTGTTEIVSENAAGTPAQGVLNWSSPVSADGRYVAFTAGGDDYNTATGGSSGLDVFVRDRTAGTTTLVSTGYDGSGADGLFPSISSDGQYVAFQSNVGPVVPDDTNGCPDVFVRDMAAGTTQRVNLTNAGDQELPSDSPDGTGPTCGFYKYPTMSADGSAVAWTSSAWNTAGLAAPDGVSTHIYVRNLTDGTTQQVDDQPVWSPGHGVRRPALSGDGKLVAYECDCDGSAAPTSIWLFDATTGERTLTGDRADGTLADDVNDLTYGGGTLSADGHYIVFTSWASNLVTNDDNDVADVYMKRLS